MITLLAGSSLSIGILSNSYSWSFTSTKLFVPVESYNCLIMMGHYFAFLDTLNRCIFLCISVAFSKWIEMRLNVKYKSKSEDKVPLPRVITASFVHLHLPMVPWVCAKYQHHFAINLLIHTILSIIDPLTYFYSLLRKGNMHFDKCNFLFS